MPMDMSPDSGINELQGLSPEEQERQKQEWQQELIKKMTQYFPPAPHKHDIRQRAAQYTARLLTVLLLHQNVE
uniref:Uncharacterized protein n=1 Tax=Timema cristinae TaxID=61476 RepID=A0A7R9H4J8_TIMCR|nr:unnamed protein product [Timema cristinae]